jgi:hypothetical protein
LPVAARDGKLCPSTFALRAGIQDRTLVAHAQDYSSYGDLALQLCIRFVRFVANQSQYH